jgi:branched-chain amino acid transport system ATP-binding protein
MTVRENVQMALISDAGRTGSAFSSTRKLFPGDAGALLRRVGMLDQAERPCAVLAYGDLKRVELAIALANRPKLLLMDEPTAGMAPNERNALMALAVELALNDGIAVLFTEHDMDVVFNFASRVLVLHAGELIAEGSPAAVRADARVREVYLGAA